MCFIVLHMSTKFTPFTLHVRLDADLARRLDDAVRIESARLHLDLDRSSLARMALRRALADTPAEDGPRPLAIADLPTAAA